MNPREPGSTLDGKYEIVQPLGSGGMGEVYLVRHVHLQELRVVKILRQDLAADPSAQKRFMREARLATQVKHPNVAILYDFSTLPDGSFYMVWEHIQGQDVGDRIRRRGPFPVPVAVHLGIQALQGLEAVHATGVIHRDLSPDNLMITEDKAGNLRLKIIDLGLARTLETDANFEITQVGMFMGKLQYCSPEQASPGGAVLDHRSDIYSFGLVLYEMISGLPPFESENQHGFIFKRLSEDPLPLRGRNPRIDVPPELDRVVRRALERDREQRFPDAGAFIAALEQVDHSLTDVQTKEIPKEILAEARGFAPPPSPQQRPRERSSSDLSKAERIDLLAQIERASKRVQETSGELTRAEAVLAAGRLDEAQELITRIEIAAPRTQGLDRLRDRLSQAREQEARARRTAETENVLKSYLQRKQLPLARLALEALLEIQPGHPRRTDYEGWIGVLADEAEKAKRAEAAFAAGREAIARKDFQAARREARDDRPQRPLGAADGGLQRRARTGRPRGAGERGDRAAPQALRGADRRPPGGGGPGRARRPGEARRAARHARLLPRAARRGARRHPEGGAGRRLRAALPPGDRGPQLVRRPRRGPGSSGRRSREARGPRPCSPRSSGWRRSSAGSRRWNRGCGRSRPSSSRGTPPRPSWPSRSSSRWTPRTATASVWRRRWAG